MDEFSLIATYFRNLGPRSALLGVGDDCALIQLAASETLAVTTDTLVAGIHFPLVQDPQLLARRCLRVNLSDLAAMGAEPRWFQLALTLPAADPDWLEAFSAGLAADALSFGCELTGGDTTRGPLTITLTMMGVLPRGQALLRSGAIPGDGIFVTGNLGDSRGALAVLDAPPAHSSAAAATLVERYWLPEPLLTMGQRLRTIASAAIDISDGLLADLGHICERSGVAAEVTVDYLPISTALAAIAGEQAAAWALTGGDDYELCFTAPADQADTVVAIGRDLGVQVTAVGRITAGTGVRCVNAAGGDYKIHERGYTHF